jgi:hypothetical protein
MITPANSIAALLTIFPLLAVAFFSEKMAAHVRSLPVWAQLTGPVCLSVPYLLVTCAAGMFRWGCFAVYALFPVAIANLLWQASRMNPATQPQREGTAVANSKAAPTTHSERRKFVLRKPMACRPSKEMDVKSTTEAAATHQSNLCQGRGVQQTIRIIA